MTSSLIALVAANLVPLAGAAFFGWSTFDLLAVYWSENVIIGVFMILRIAASPGLPLPATLGMSVFFVLHYGLFCFVHAVFLVGLAGDNNAPQDFFAAPSHLLASAASTAGGIGVIALIASHAVSFGKNYLAHERHHGKPDLFAPYRRVVVMHVVLLAGAFVSVFAGGGALLLTLLVVAKVAADVMAHRAEHRRPEPETPVVYGAKTDAPVAPAAPVKPAPPDQDSGDDYIALE